MSGKNIKFIVIALLSFVVIFLSVASLTDDDADKIEALFSVVRFDSDFTDDKPLSLYNFEKLNTTEKQAYIAIFNNIRKHPEYIKIPDLTNEEFKNVYFAVKNDNPDILCFPDSCDMVTFYNASFIRMSYKTDIDKCNSMTVILHNKADEISALCDAATEYDRELFFHDYLIKNCRYDENAEFGSDAYGCIVSGAAYCSGYSRAMMLLLIKNGTDCILVSGNAVSDNEYQSHMWNIVTINGQNYHLDVTWDDHDQNDNIPAHIYFNVTTEQILLTHSDISVSLECTSADDNYFNREGLLFDTFDVNACRTISKKLSDNIYEDKYYVEFKANDSETFDYTYNKLFNESSSDSAFYLIINSMDSSARNLIDASHINTVTDKEQNYIRLMFDKK